MFSVLAMSFCVSTAWVPTELAKVEGVDTPESAYIDENHHVLYVSNVAGKATEKDGKGWISRVDLSNPEQPKVTDMHWIDGLDAPKGIRVRGNTLWVTNLSEVIKVDVKAGKISKRIAVPGAQFLNDLTVGKDGTVYVSDTFTSEIFTIKGDKVESFSKGDDLESPNGLLVLGNELIVAAWGLTKDFSNETSGRLYALNLKTKARRNITVQPIGNLDGLEALPDGSFIATDWKAGTVFQVDKGGHVNPILSLPQGSADIGVTREKSGAVILTVPQMNENSISVYRLKPEKTTGMRGAKNC